LISKNFELALPKYLEVKALKYSQNIALCVKQRENNLEAKQKLQYNR
jgi:hypothetical protein